MAQKTEVKQAGVSFNEVKTFLLKATAKQKGEVAMLLGLVPEGPVKNDAASSSSRVLYDEVSEFLAKATGGALPPFGAGYKTWGPNIAEAVIALDAYLTPARLGQVSVTRQMQILAYAKVVEVVYCAMRASGMPLTPKTLFQQLRLVALHMDNAFPGYAPAGLLHWVFKPPKM